MLRIAEGHSTLEQFGFEIVIENQIATFTKTRDSLATYPDGQARSWQGETTFQLKTKPWGRTQTMYPENMIQ